MSEEMNPLKRLLSEYIDDKDIINALKERILKMFERDESLFSSFEDKVVTAARVAHQANKAYCESLGDFSQKNWEQAEEWQRTSSINGVLFMVDRKLQGEQNYAGILHENWMQEKLADGWTYGEEKDPDLKTHPCLVPFEKLPEEQKKKDMIFMAGVIAVMFK